MNVHMELFDRRVNRDYGNIHSMFLGYSAQKMTEIGQLKVSFKMDILDGQKAFTENSV